MKDPWGREIKPDHVQYPFTVASVEETYKKSSRPRLPIGYGLSPGDVSANHDDLLISSVEMKKIISFDEVRGQIECEAGVTFASINKYLRDTNWSLPVFPSTERLTIGGAIANDVHGRDHVKSGSFGNHVIELNLICRGKTTICSDTVNRELFRATIGGIGLTGFITSAKVALTRRSIRQDLEQSKKRFGSLRELVEGFSEYKDWDFVTGWLDGLAATPFDSCYIQAHRFSSSNNISARVAKDKVIPFRVPRLFFNKLTMRLFNLFHLRMISRFRRFVSFDQGVYQMDKLKNYYKLYGREGFASIQFCLPKDHVDGIFEIQDFLASKNERPMFAIAKPFGKKKPKGLLSFPQEGVTFAFDFFRTDLERIHRDLVEIIGRHGGRVYFAKDVFLRHEEFLSSYDYKEFSKFVDADTCSDFWRRVAKI